MNQQFKEDNEDDEENKIVFVEGALQCSCTCNKNETLKDLKTRIYNELHIPIHRQKLLFEIDKNKNIFHFEEETNDNELLSELQKRSRYNQPYMCIEFHPKINENDLINVKINNKRKYNIEGNQGDFYANVDIFKNIMKQICELKNFEKSKSYLYLVYCNYYGNNRVSPKENKYYCEYDTDSHYFICLQDILKDFHDKKELQFNLCDFSESPEIDINVNTTFEVYN